MEQFYKDLEEILYPEKGLDSMVHSSIKRFEPIQIALEELIEALKEAKKPNQNKEQYDNINKKINKKIRTILHKIKEINGQYFLHIDRIINNDSIDEEELELALNILNENPETQKIIKKVKIYKEKVQDIVHLQNEDIKQEEEKNNTLNFLELYFKENERKYSLLEKIFKRKAIKERKNEVLKRLIKNIERLISKCKEYKLNKKAEGLETLKNQIINNNKINKENAKAKINEAHQAIKNEITNEINAKKEEQEEIKIPLKKDQLDAMIMKDNQKNHLYNMLFGTFNSEKEKKKTLLGRVLITLKFITLLKQKNLQEEQIYNMPSQIKQSEQKKK